LTTEGVPPPTMIEEVQVPITTTIEEQ